MAAGGQVLDSAITARVTIGFAGRDTQKGRHVGTITDREAHVIRLIAWGHGGTRKLPAQLELSVKTVEVHKANAMRKLALRGRIDIVRYAVLQGWLHDS